MNIYDKKAFCKGTLCRKHDRKFKSIVSKKEMCGNCAVDLGNHNYCTFDELVMSDHPEIKKAFQELIKDENKLELVNKHIT